MGAGEMARNLLMGRFTLGALIRGFVFLPRRQRLQARLRSILHRFLEMGEQLGFLVPNRRFFGFACGNSCVGRASLPIGRRASMAIRM